MFLVSALVFLLVELAPGDAAVAVAGGEGMTAEEYAQMRARLGLDQPLYVRYVDWMGGVLTGDLGTSLLSSQSVSGEIIRRLPVTLSLTMASVIVALLISVPLGVIAAVKRDSAVDRFVTFLATMGVATPNFFLGMLLVLFVALSTGWFPSFGYVEPGDSLFLWANALVLPAITLGTSVAAEMTRHIRASMRDVLEQDFIRTVRSRGLPFWTVVGKHGFKNAAIPVTTVFGIQVQNLLGGSVVVETVFGLPGLGNLIVKSVFQRDFPMIQGVMLTTVIVIVLVNLLVDVSYGYFNPKVRAS